MGLSVDNETEERKMRILLRASGNVSTKVKRVTNAFTAYFFNN